MNNNTRNNQDQPNYTDEQGLANYEDNMIALKVIAIAGFLIWFGFLA